MAVILIHGLIGKLFDPAIASAIGDLTFGPDLLGYGERRGYAGEISLAQQVLHMHRLLESADRAERVHLVGHSIGGAIAMLYAHEFPQRVASVVSVEGNFTLKDAFWSRTLAQQSAEEIDRLLAADVANPIRWLERSGVVPNEARIAKARADLKHQSGATVRAMARSVVEITGKPEYLELVRGVFDNIPVQLVAGARSREAWDVPSWALGAADGVNTLPDTGHLLPLEAPAEFGALIRRLVHSSGDTFV